MKQKRIKDLVYECLPFLFRGMIGTVFFQMINLNNG